MKNIAILFTIFLLFEGCTLFTPRDEFFIGMREEVFLRRNRDAVISELNESQKIYRVQRTERFYALVTFVDGELISVDEKEVQQWQIRPEQQQQQQQMQQGYN